MKNAISLILVLGSFACQSQNGKTNALEPDEFEKGVRNTGVQVLDVRTASEFKSGHIKNALQADWTDQAQFTDRVQYVDKSKPVYVYCLVGGRSAAAANWMRQNGFNPVFELKGGINAWKKSGKPVEGSPEQPILTLEQYGNLIPKNGTTLVDIGAAWCPPCVKMAPLITELQQAGPAFTLVNIDAGVQTELMKALNVGPIPTFIVYKNGRETWRKDGIVSKEEFLAQLK